MKDASVKADFRWEITEIRIHNNIAIALPEYETWTLISDEQILVVETGGFASYWMEAFSRLASTSHLLPSIED